MYDKSKTFLEFLVVGFNVVLPSCHVPHLWAKAFGLSLNKICLMKKGNVVLYIAFEF